MRIWRISNFDDLSGIGGLKTDGRWHDRGRHVVYAADHPASALLEVMVHLEIDVEGLADQLSAAWY
ncbi:MAG TPA: RES family NAD+ phosphorylase [Bradyrhizobium sp.]|nr:RES family NAD+ phosphorylase [Bradyrhizobium sp.]